MNTSIQPYLFFNGRCEEALRFYEEALDAKVEMMMRFGESPEPPPPGAVPDNYDDKIMHATFHVGDNTLLASDGCEPESKFGGFSLSITAADEAQATRMFNALAEGGTISLPLTKTFFSPCFGMLTDKFGLGWMVGVHPG